MRKQHEMLFMGKGDISLAQCYALEGRLREAFSTLGSVQQPVHSSSKEEAIYTIKQQQKTITEIEDFVRDIAAAFTGKEIQFVKKEKEYYDIR